MHEVGLDNTIYASPDTDVWKEAWRVTEGIIKLMRSEVEGNGAKFLLVSLTNGIQVDPDTENRRKYEQQLGVNDLFYPDKRIRALGDREGFPVISLVPHTNVCTILE